MDSFELNKIIGALLGVVFVIFSISLISDAIFASPEPEKPGYAIEATEGAGAAGGGEAKKEEVEDIKPMLASADIDKGKAVFKRCAACHTDDQSGANKVGPNLWGVVDRPIASHEGFSYSAAMKEFSQGSKEHWTYDHLNNFLHGPKKVVPGTAMGFAGLPKAEDRANVIAYLRTQADSPAPLPSPEEAAKEGDKAAAEGDKGADKAGAEADKGGEKTGAEGADAKKAGEAAKEGDDAKAPADNADTGKAEGKAPAAGTDDEGKAPAAKSEEPSDTESDQAKPAEQSAPATESPSTESDTTGGEKAEPKQDEGSGSSQ